MSAVTGFYNNVYRYPVRNVPLAVVFPILDNTGALVSGAAGLDSERSKDGNTFADCTNEATEIGSSGMYYLLLDSSELDATILTVVVKTSTTNAKTTPMVFYPQTGVLITGGTAQGGTSNTVTLETAASAVDNFYRGMYVAVNIDGTVEYRIITSYVGATRVATVTPLWVTADPDNTDNYTVLATEAIAVLLANVTAWLGSNVATPLVAGIPTVQPVDNGWRQP